MSNMIAIAIATTTMGRIFIRATPSISTSVEPRIRESNEREQDARPV